MLIKLKQQTNKQTNLPESLAPRLLLTHFDEAAGDTLSERAGWDQMTTNTSEQLLDEKVAVVKTPAICCEGQQICHYQPCSATSFVCLGNNLVI